MQKRLLKSYLQKVAGQPFAVTFWDGEMEIFGTADKDSEKREHIL